MTIMQHSLSVIRDPTTPRHTERYIQNAALIIPRAKLLINDFGRNEMRVARFAAQV